MGNPLARYDGKPYSLYQLLESCSSVWRRTLLVRLKPSRISLTLFPPMVQVSFSARFVPVAVSVGTTSVSPPTKKRLPFVGTCVMRKFSLLLLVSTWSSLTLQRSSVLRTLRKTEKFWPSPLSGMLGSGSRFRIFCPIGEMRGFGITLLANCGKAVPAAGTILVFVH